MGFGHHGRMVAMDVPTLGQIRGQSEVDFGPILCRWWVRGPSAVDVGSTRGIGQGSLRGRPGADPRSLRGRSGADAGSMLARF